MTYEGKPVSLYPLKIEEAVKELLKVKPEPRNPKEKKRPVPEDRNLPRKRS
jgi:hypothetical protein